MRPGPLPRPALLLALAVLPALQAGPRLVLDRTRHDFGRVPPGRKVVTSFRLTNGGDRPLHLGPVETSCGCTAASPGRSVLAPGEGTSLTVTYDPGRDHGPVLRVVTVRSDAPGASGTDLELRAVVALPIALEPEALLFRDLLGDERRTREVAWSAPRPLAPAPLELPPWLRLDPGPAAREGRLRVTLDGAAVPGPTGLTRVRLATGDPAQPELVLEVRWSGGEAIRVEPATLAFDPGPPPQLRTLVLREALGRPFRVLAAACEPPLFRVEAPGGTAGPEQVLRVTFPPGGAPGLHTAVLQVRTDHPLAPHLEIPVSAWLD
jgi:hypothetical protein